MPKADHEEVNKMMEVVAVAFGWPCYSANQAVFTGKLTMSDDEPTEGCECMDAGMSHEQDAQATMVDRSLRHVFLAHCGIHGGKLISRRRSCPTTMSGRLCPQTQTGPEGSCQGWFCWITQPSDSAKGRRGFLTNHNNVIKIVAPLKVLKWSEQSRCTHAFGWQLLLTQKPVGRFRMFCDDMLKGALWCFGERCVWHTCHGWLSWKCSESHSRHLVIGMLM